MKSMFYYRPRPGDVWEIRIPGKSKKIKTVNYVYMQDYLKKDFSIVQHPRVEWERLPKGRYTGLRVKWLLKYGKLIKRRADGQSTQV